MYMYTRVIHVCIVYYMCMCVGLGPAQKREDGFARGEILQERGVWGVSPGYPHQYTGTADEDIIANLLLFHVIFISYLYYVFVYCFLGN